MILLFFLVVCCANNSVAADFSGPEYAFMFYQDKPDKPKIKSLQSLARKRVVNLLQSPALQSPTFVKQIRNTDNPLAKRLVISKLLKECKPRITATSIRPRTLLLPSDTQDQDAQEIIHHKITFDDHNMLVAHTCFVRSNIAPHELAHIRIWDTQNRQQILHINYHRPITALCFNPTSDQFAIGDTQRQIAILNMHGHELLQLQGHEDIIHSLYYSPDSSKLISYAGGTVRIWSMHDGRCIHTIAHGSLPNGRVVRMSLNRSPIHALAARNGVVIYNNNKRLHTITCKDQPSRVSYSNNGKMLAAAFDNGSVQLYDCPSYQQAIEEIDIRQTLYILNTLKECNSLLNSVRPLGSFDRQLSLYNSLPNGFKSVIQQHRFCLQEKSINRCLWNIQHLIFAIAAMSTIRQVPRITPSAALLIMALSLLCHCYNT